MLAFVINHIIFLCILTAQFLCKKKHPNVFVLLYILYFYYAFSFGVYKIFDEIYAIDLILFFVFPYIFDIKRCIVLSLVCSAFLFLFKDIYYDNNLIVFIDICVIFLYTAFSIFCKKKIFIDSYPNVSLSFSFSIVYTTMYAIVYFLFEALSGDKNMFSQSYITIALAIRILKSIVSLLTILLIVNFFNKESRHKNNSLMKIFIRKFNYLIVIFTLFAVVFCLVFNYLYLTSYFERVLRFNYDMAKNDLNASVKEYGDNCLDYDNTVKEVFGTWTLDIAGAVYILNKDFSLAVDFSDLSHGNFLDSSELKPENFKGILDYAKGKIFTFKNDKKYYMVIYDTIGNYYLVAFFAYYELLPQILVPTTASLFMIIVNVLLVFMLIYSIFKNYVVNRLWAVNKKLNEITEGNYDVVFTDKSSEEFKLLSDNINHTVNTIKTNIAAIENKNKEELDLARKIQVSQLPLNSDVTIAHSGYGINIPAEDVGGDFYDNFSVNSRKRIILIADVSGKGIPAALFMMKAKHTIINLAKQHDNMEVIFEETNKILSVNNPTIMFVTCFAVMIDLVSGKLSMINAGHNKPIIIRKANGKKECEYIDMEPSHILGIDNKSKYTSKEMTFEKGDSLILYTDGVTEAKNISKEQYGNDRLIELVKNIENDEPKDICDAIVNSVKEFANGAPQSDDITIYSVKYNGPDNTLTMKADYDAIDKGKAFVNKFTRVYSIDNDTSRNLKVVFDEIACNIIKYAYKEKIGDITLGLNMLPDSQVEMVFIDSGVEFDPTKYDNNSGDRGADEKINGGMGIMFCKNMMDKCVYERIGCKNIFKLYKKVKHE